VAVNGWHIRRIRYWGAAVFHEKRDGWHCRLVVVGSEAMVRGAHDDRLPALLGGFASWLDLHDRVGPHKQTRTVVMMRVLADQLEGMVWRRENE